MQARFFKKLLPNNTRHTVKIFIEAESKEIKTKQSFTTNGKEISFYHQRLNVPVLSEVTEGSKIYDFLKLGNFNKNP